MVKKNVLHEKQQPAMENSDKKKEYREIRFLCGIGIGCAIEKLKEQTDLACGYFNGHILYSDIDDIDSAYKKITGKTKAECDSDYKALMSRIFKEETKHKESIQELKEKFIKKGKALLAEKYHKKWEEIVPIRLGDIYNGLELNSCLEIIEVLNSIGSLSCLLDQSKRVIDGQGHSGTSFGLVCSMVKAFCDRGSEFVKFVC